MNQVHGPLSSASNFLSIFEGGRGPELWREQQSEWVEWIRATRRDSCWIEDLTSVDLELCGRPLLGNTLGALVARNINSRTVAAESTTARATFSEPTRAGNHKSKPTSELNGRKAFRPAPETKRAVPTPQTSGKDAAIETVSQLQPQADASFLRRLAGEAREFASDRRDSLTETNRTVAERLQPHRLQRSTRVVSRSAPVERFAATTPMAQVEPATLLERAARRIKRTWARDSLTTRGLAAHAREVKPDLRSLTDHWSMPVSGPGASANLLIRLAGSDRYQDQVDETVRETLRRGRSESQPPSARVAEQSYDPASATAPVTHSSTPAVAPVIAPPSVTPMLPSLHSHKQDDVVLPVAAATAQRQARIEEEIAREDDLPLLAERLDRILKQEARRHGIDV